MVLEKPKGEPMAAAVDLEQRNVGAFVHADDLGLELALAIRQAHGDVVEFRHYVRIGEDVAVCADDEARAEAAARLARAAAVAARDVGHEPTEEFQHRIFLRLRLSAARLGRRLFVGRYDVHNCRPLHLHEGREIGEGNHGRLQAWAGGGGLARPRGRRLSLRLRLGRRSAAARGGGLGPSRNRRFGLGHGTLAPLAGSACAERQSDAHRDRGALQTHFH
jgi:hypothetical protein